MIGTGLTGRLIASCIAALLIPAWLLGASSRAYARITSITITSRISPAFGGKTFGPGTYEELDGVATGEVDPNNPLNAVITDIALAPRNARGMVEYSMDISILKPVDESKGNHVMLYDVVNRGNKVVPGLFNVGATAADPAGDGFLENQGYTMVWSGWQGDLVPQPGQLGIRVPVAHHRDGATITGLVRTEFTLNAPTSTQNLTAGFSSNTPGYPTVSLDNSGDVLTQRVHQYDQPQVIPNKDWAFADCTSQPFPGTPNPQRICIGPNGAGGTGFDTNHIYELYYKAKDPLVLGLGFAATRDLIAFLRRSSDPQNPLAGVISHTLMHGTSQDGRWVRNFLNLGFNEDETGQIVADGMNPHIGSVQGDFNVRFGQPGRLAGTEHTEKQYPGPDSPLSYGDTFDPYRHLRAGLLDRCRQTDTCPKIVQTMTDVEYWSASGAIDTTDPLGIRDLPQPSNVRIYQFASTQHGGYSPIAPLPTSTGICQQLPNANSYTYNLRALLVALTRWVVNGTQPPASDYSRIQDGTLVRPEAVRFPTIPGVSYDVSELFNTRILYFRGYKFDETTESGILSEPPIPLIVYPGLLPQVDRDGNDIGGIRSTTLQAPLGTYTGWNTRRAGFSEGDSCDLTGSYIPFAVQKADRVPGDPRLSLEERYGNHAGYVAAVTAAAQKLLQQGYLLPADAQATINAAQASNVLNKVRPKSGQGFESVTTAGSSRSGVGDTSAM